MAMKKSSQDLNTASSPKTIILEKTEGNGFPKAEGSKHWHLAVGRLNEKPADETEIFRH